MKKVEVIGSMAYRGVTYAAGDKIDMRNCEAIYFTAEGLVKELLIPENRQKK